MPLKKNDIVYYARILPASSIYDVLELKVRTVANGWFVGIEKRDKQAFLFSNSLIDKCIFRDRKSALDAVKIAEVNKKENYEVFYDEY